MWFGALLLDSTRRPRTLWRFGVFAALLGVLVLVALVASTAGAMLFLVVTGLAGGAREAGQMIEGGGAVTYAVLAVPVTAATLGAVWFCRRFLDRRDMASLGLGRPERRLGASPWVGLVVGAAPIVVAAAALLVLGRAHVEQAEARAGALALLLGLAVPAFFEELVCRGYLLRNMVEIGRPVAGVIVTSALFSLLHVLNPGYLDSPLVPLNLLLAGVFLALGYLLSGNLWFPTAMHFAWNAAQGPVLGVPVSGMPTPSLVRLAGLEGPDMLTGGAFGLEGSVLTTVALVAACAGLIALLRRRSARAAGR